MSEEIQSVPFFRASIGKEEKDAVERVLDSLWLTTGKEAHSFEEEFASKISCKYALSVNSNTSGMIMAMEAVGVTQGKAVITTPYTFVSTASSARHLGADVYFADVEKDSYAIDPSCIEKILESPRGRNVVAIVPVHIAGFVCDMERIMQIAKKYNVKVIEDCAHAFPSKTKFGYAGTLGDIGVFSFYATKTITTGEGGMITTNNGNLYSRMKTMRLHGMNRDAWDRYTSPKASWEYDIIAPGFKSNLPDILAAIGREQLKKADSFFDKRKAHVMFYNNALKDFDFVSTPPDGDGNAWHLYLLRLNLDKLKCTRDTFALELQQKGIGISMHYIPLFNFTYWKNLYKDFTKEYFPNAQNQYLRTITIPLWPDMTEQMTAQVVKAIKETGEKYHV